MSTVDVAQSCDDCLDWNANSTLCSNTTTLRAARTHGSTTRTPTDTHDALFCDDDVRGVLEDDYRRRKAGNDDEDTCV